MAKLDERYTRDIAAENYERIIANLESEVARLRKAIRNYGEHLMDCDAWFDGRGPCTCGLRAVTEEESDGKTR